MTSFVPPPAGSETQWRDLALTAALCFCAGGLYGWSGLIPALEAAFVVPATGSGLVFSLAIIAFSFAVMFWPRLASRFETMAPMALIGMAGAASLVLAATANSYGAFLLWFSVGFGSASGAIYIASLSTAAAAQRRNLATAAMVTAFGMGGVVFGPMWRILVERGWGLSSLVPLAAALFAASLASLWIARVQPTGKDGARSNGHGRTPGGTSARPPRHMIGLVWLTFATGSFAGLMVLGLATKFIEESGGSVALSGIVLGCIALSNTSGRLWVAALAVILPDILLPLFASLVVTIGLVVALMADGAITLSVGLALTALGYGTMASAVPIVTGAIFGPDEFAKVYSIIFTGWGTAGLLAPLSAGFIFDQTGTFLPAVWLAITIGLMSSAASAAVARSGYQYSGGGT